MRVPLAKRQWLGVDEKSQLVVIITDQTLCQASSSCLYIPPNGIVSAAFQTSRVAVAEAVQRWRDGSLYHNRDNTRGTILRRQLSYSTSKLL
jgi:hypothetical protein